MTNALSVVECDAPGCRRQAECKGMCMKHYARIRRNGTLELTRGRSVWMDTRSAWEQWYPLAGFQKQSKAWDGLNQQCRGCKNKAFRWHRIKFEYGLTRDEYERLLRDQGGKCAACGGTCKREWLSVDHDHETGRVRALLCHGCNVALGFLNEDGERARQLAEYIDNQIPKRLR